MLPVTLACVRGPQLRMLFALPALPLPVPQLNLVNQGINLHLTSFTWIPLFLSYEVAEVLPGTSFLGGQLCPLGPLTLYNRPFWCLFAGPNDTTHTLQSLPPPTTSIHHTKTQIHYLTPARTLDDPAIRANLIFSACPAPRACSVH